MAFPFRLLSAITILVCCLGTFLGLCMNASRFADYLETFVPICGDTTYTPGLRMILTGGRIDMVRALKAIFWRKLFDARLCRKIPPTPWLAYIAGATVFTTIGFVTQKCWREGPFRAILDSVTSVHPLKDMRRKASLVTVPKFVKTAAQNAHAGGASLRLQVHRWIHAICAEFPSIPAAPGLVRFDISKAVRDEQFGSTVIGRRRVISPVDLTVDRCHEDDYIPGLPVSAVDTAFYLKAREWDEFAGAPIVFNCIVPKAVAWKTDWSHAYIDEDSRLTEVVDGGETYNHSLIDPTQHKFTLYSWSRSYIYEQSIMLVPNSNQAVFVWVPVAVVRMPKWVYIPWHYVCFRQLPTRPGNWKGASKVVLNNKAGEKISFVQVAIPSPSRKNDTISCREESWKNGECTVIDRKCADVIAIRAFISEKETNVYDASSVLAKAGQPSTPETNTIAAAISQQGKSPDLTLPVAFQPGSDVETHGLKTPVEEVITSSTNVPARVCAVNDEALAAELKRSAELQAKVPRTISLAHATAIDTAIDYICNIIGVMQPISEADAIAAQKGPAQKKRNEAMLATDVEADPQVDAKPSQKNEAVTSVSTRSINPCNTSFGIALSRYMRPLATGMKQLACYGPGCNGVQIADKIAAVMATGPATCNDVSDNDKSHGPLSREGIFERFVFKVFESDEYLQSIMAKERKVKMKNPLFSFHTSGMNISGLPDTTLMNTTVIMLLTLAAMILEGKEPDVTTCGLFSGDDSIIPDKYMAQFLVISKAYGFTIKSDDLRDGSMVKFLNRIYFDPTVSTTSVPSMVRFLNKFGVLTTSNAGYAEKIAGVRVSDPYNPLLRAFCNAQSARVPDMKKRLEKLKKAPTKELSMKLDNGAFPFEARFKSEAISVMAWELGVPSKYLDDWIVKASLVKDEAGWAALPLLYEGVAKEGKLPSTPVPYPQQRKKK